MSDESLVRPLFHICDEIAARNNLHQALGAVMAQWASIEDRLLYWFMVITGLPELMARAVFFSAKSFSGRADMLQDSIAPSTLDAGTQTFIKEALKVAVRYSGFRNKAAHRQPLFHVDKDAPTYLQYLLAEGGLPLEEAVRTAVTLPQLAQATGNFRELGRLLGDMLPAYRKQCGASPQSHLRLVLELPNEAHSREPRQIPREKLQQLQSILGSPPG